MKKVENTTMNYYIGTVTFYNVYVMNMWFSMDML